MIVQSTLHHQVGALREALTALMETSTQQDPSPRRPAEALGDPPFGDDAFSERCRLALHRLIGLSTEGVIMVSSPQRKEGRSSVAAAMAGIISGLNAIRWCGYAFGTIITAAPQARIYRQFLATIPRAEPQAIVHSARSVCLDDVTLMGPAFSGQLFSG